MNRISLTEFDEMVRLTGRGEDGCYSCCEDGFKEMISQLPAPHRDQASWQPPGPSPRPCVCKGLKEAPGINSAHVHSMVKLAMGYYAVRPWLQMRMNHVLKVKIPWVKMGEGESCEVYVQVLGGTGNCEPSLVVSESIEEVQFEGMFAGKNPRSTMRMLKVIFEKPEFLAENVRTLLYLKELKVRFGKGGVVPWEQDIVPTFSRCMAVRVGNESGALTTGWRIWQPDLNEMMMLHASLAAVMCAVGKLEHVAGTPSGDYKAFYPLGEVEFEVDDAVDVFKVGHRGRAIVSFPYRKERSKMSPLQRIGFRERGEGSSNSVEANFKFRASGCSDLKVLEQMDQCLRIKADGNAHFQRGNYRGAFAKYTEALAGFPQKDTIRDDGVMIEWETIMSNRAQAAFRMGDNAACIKDANEVIGYPVICTNKHHVRSLFARARAHRQINQIDNAVDDFQALYRSLIKMGELKQAKSVVTTLRDLIRERKDTVAGKVTWRKLPGEGSLLPGPLCFHTAVCWDNKLYVYGGIPDMDAAFSLEKKDFSSDLWILDLATNEWRRKKTSGGGPLVTRHTAVLHEDQMFVFGGEGPSSENNTHRLSILNLRTLRWENIRGRNQPRARSEHCAVAYNGRMYVFGGMYVDRNELSATDILISMSFSNYKWRRESTVGDVPPMLSSSIACVHRDALVIHGGQLTQDDGNFHHLIKPYSCDLHLYEFDQQRWRKIDQVGGYWPRSRAETGAVSFANRSIYIHGGYSETSNGSQYHGDSLRLYTKGKSLEWQRCAESQDGSPGARAGCTLTAVDDEDRAILVGGYNTMVGVGNLLGSYKIPFQDAWELFLSKKSSVEVELVACANCKKEGRWKKCRGCKAVRYCSLECQQAQWESHKQVCGWTRKDAEKMDSGKK